MIDVDCMRTQLYYPEGFTAANTLGPLGQKGIVAAGGLHKEIKGAHSSPSGIPQSRVDPRADKYFRLGHMGITAVEPSRGDVDKVIDGLKAIFKKE